MAVEIHPIRLIGNWDIGYALDKHVINSVYLYDDPYGRPQFDNTYSEIGELLKHFKYNNQYSNLNEIVSTVKLFLSEHPEMCDFETIIPVPPSKSRDYQPTWEIGKALAKSMGKFFVADILVKISGPESKGLPSEEKHQIKGTIQKKLSAIRKHSILLLDDLYKTGTTISECVRVLRQDPLIDKIYVIAITKTKNQY